MSTNPYKVHDDEEEPGVCMNCGEEMDYNPSYPWCPDCEEGEDVDA